MQARAIVLLMDSFGIGASEDAVKYGDVGANTFGNIVKACADGSAGRGALQLPNLARLGLVKAAELSAGPLAAPVADVDEVQAAYGYAVEQSFGKDTPSGHWEIAGVPVLFDWGYFAAEGETFPKALLDDFIREAKLPGVLGCCHASGTTIINELGDEHIRTGKPIVYTSADSVFQIAAHEERFGLDRLYEICQIARRLVDDYQIGRVIARPFVGASGDYQRTANRKDLSTPPPEKTLLDRLVEQGGEMIAIGKTADIYAHQGVTEEIKAANNDELFSKTLAALQQQPDQPQLIFTNFVDFDSKYGHRRNVKGYADALEAFDARLPELEALLQPNDLVVITADHGCDPTQPGSDHTREHIPVLFFGYGVQPGSVGKRNSFADIGQTLAKHLGIQALNNGTVCF